MSTQGSPYTDAVRSMYHTLCDYWPRHPVYDWSLVDCAGFFAITTFFTDMGVSLLPAIGMAIFGIVGARFILAAVGALLVDEPPFA